jgi:transcriptional regulator NrdR family protein
VEKITREIERKILLLRQKEVLSEEIGEIVLQTLKSLSPGVFLSFLVTTQVLH